MFPIPKCEADVEKFLYYTVYLKMLIPDRVELAKILKEALVRDKSEGKKRGKVVGFVWNEAQQKAFDAIKQAVRDNVVVRGNSELQYHLSVTARDFGFGAVLFQLNKDDQENWEMEKTQLNFPREGKELFNLFHRRFQTLR